jgi:hypothetical protein
LVDLAIFDASNSFIFSDFEAFFVPFSTAITKHSVLESAFREIFLVTQKFNKNGGYSSVVVPLKLNLFAQASTIYMDLILEELNTTSDEYNIELQNIFLSCLNQTGFSHFETLEINGDFCIALGCYLYIYTKDGVTIRDYTRLSEELPVGITVSNVIKEREIKNLDIVKEVLAKRKEFQCYVPLRAGTGPGLELSVFPSRNDKSRVGVCITNQAGPYPGSVTLHLIALPLNYG